MKTEKQIIEQMPAKEKMLQACLAKQRQLIADFNRGIDELAGSGSREEGADQPGLVEEVALRRRQLTDQLSFAKEELKILEDMLPGCNEKHDAVGLGSAVVTDNGIFYVSVSIERFDAEGMPIFGVSLKSPLYKAMSGKRKGESFAFGPQTYWIMDVY